MDKAVAAYGGPEPWRRAGAVQATVSAGGFAFASKWQRPFRRMKVRAEIREPRTRMTPLEWAGRSGFLDGPDRVRLEGLGGKLLEERENPRRLFPGGRRMLWWDRLDQVYFSGYALWNYLAFPALLLREDIAWTEPAPGTLEARFPPHLPTHSERQRFHFDRATGLLLQHDYTAEVFGGWAKAANVVLAHGDADGVPYPSRRRVTPRAADGRPRGFPVLVWIEIDDWRLV